MSDAALCAAARDGNADRRRWRRGRGRGGQQVKNAATRSTDEGTFVIPHAPSGQRKVVAENADGAYGEQIVEIEQAAREGSQMGTSDRLHASFFAIRRHSMTRAFRRLA